MSDPIFSAPAQTNPFGLTNVGQSATPTFADIDGDGLVDVFVGNKDGVIQYFHNIGSVSAPNFVIDVGIGLIDPGLYAKPAFVDIDGDGDLDAFIGANDGNILFYRNVGSQAVPDMSEETNNFGLTNLGNYASPTFADIDNDGDLDAFVGVADGNTLFFRNTGSVATPNFVSESGNFGLTDVGLSAVPTFTDVDGDGDLDAFVGGPLDPVFFRNTGTANVASFVSETSNFGLTGVGQYSTPSFADIDGDGDLDAFVGNNAGNTLFFRNDQAGIKITPSGSGNAVTEGGAIDTYTVVLNRQPTANVTITLDNTNNQVNTNKITLTFTPANWNVAQTVTLTAANDNLGEGKHSGAIKHTVTSADVLYNGLVIKPVTVVITDNDLPKVSNPSFLHTTLLSGLSSTGVPVANFADIDGDGDIDVFVGDSDGTTTLFRNIGTTALPSFASQSSNFGLTDVGISAAPSFADIDGDGDLDAFVGERYGSIVFFRNTNTALSPSFTSEANNFGLIQESGSARPAFADIDGDGDMDAFVGTGDGTLRFFRNVGTANAPSFVKQSTNLGLTSAGVYASPSFADLDGDGDLDAVIGKDSSTLYFKNIGNATNPNFSAVGTNVFGLTVSGDRYITPTFADLDGDGDLDALFGTNGGLKYLVNALPGITVRQSGDSTTVTEVGVKDRYTIVLGSIPTADVTITLDNTNNQITTDLTTLTFTAANWNIPQTVTVTAVNDTVGEGTHTGVIKYTVTSTDVIYNGMLVKPVIVNIADNDLPQRNPTFNTALNNPFGLSNVGNNSSPEFADIDGDGDLDAFVGSKNDGIIYFKNTGSTTAPQFVRQTGNLGITTLDTESNPSFADIDGDGDLDAFVGSFDGSIKYFRNNGSAEAPRFVVQTANLGLTNIGSKASPTFVDIDNDGDFDAFVGKGSGGALSFFRNTGTASAAKFVSEARDFGLNGLGSNVKPDFADWDGDGDLDAMVGSFSATTFFRNNGSKTAPIFIKQTGTFGQSNASFASNPTLADIDGDGDLDAFVGFYYGDTAFYLNNIKPTLTAFAAPVATGNEDNRIAINLAQLKAQGNEADADGTVTGFVIKAVSSGSLFIGTNSVTATAWTPGSNDKVDASHQAFWLPPSNANGALKAFTAVAYDNNNGESAIARQVNAIVNPINDAPQFSALIPSINYTDTKFDDTFAIATGKLTATDAEGSTLTFGVSGGANNPNGTASVTNAFGTFVLNKTSGVYSFSPNDSAIEALSANANIGFLVSVSDGAITTTATLTINFSQSGTTETNGNDALNGTAGSDKFNTLGGNDTINAGAGADIMVGGTGNDTYLVDNAADKVIETSTLATELDLVKTTVNYILPANVENLTMLGTLAMNGTGNGSNNTIVGNSGSNILNGLAGIDTLTGGLGKDIFRLTTLTRDKITDFNVVDDTIQLENAVMTALTATGILGAGLFKIGAATDGDDHILYNSATGILTYDSNGNVAGGATQIAILATGLALSNTDFAVI